MPELGRALRVVSLGALVLAAHSQLNPANAAPSVQSVGVSLTQPVPMGSSYQTLERTTGVELRALIGSEWAPSDLNFSLTGNYQSFGVRGLAGAKVDYWGFFAGVQTGNAAGSGWIVPGFGVEIGGMYDSLRLASVNGSQTNSDLLFAFRAVPGIAIPVLGTLDATFDFPVTAVFSSRKLMLWTGQFGIRWRL